MWMRYEGTVSNVIPLNMGVLRKGRGLWMELHSYLLANGRPNRPRSEGAWYVLCVRNRFNSLKNVTPPRESRAKG